jgi:hypothetical protein
MNEVNRLTLAEHCQSKPGCSRVQTFINVYKRLNSDNVIFGMGVKCLVNSIEQRKRDKPADIY